MDYLEKEFGIKKDIRYYSIYFKLQDIKDITQVKGEILNFTYSQVVIKSKDGLYIIQPQNIVEMIPLFIPTNNERNFINE